MLAKVLGRSRWPAAAAASPAWRSRSASLAAVIGSIGGAMLSQGGAPVGCQVLPAGRHGKAEANPASRGGLEVLLASPIGRSDAARPRRSASAEAEAQARPESAPAPARATFLEQVPLEYVRV